PFLHLVSRASHKLEDILKSHRYDWGGGVLDLGCAPGGWMEYHSYRALRNLPGPGPRPPGDQGAGRDLGGGGRAAVVGVDLLECGPGS
ncbi:hypothetical protein TrRE_jg2794, partial [Triparma retinervis]